MDYKDENIWLMQGDCLEEGTNNALDYKLPNGMWAKTVRIGNTWYVTKSCKVWNAMLGRCKNGGILQKHRPTYEGCSVSEEFLDYQYFTDWYSSQIGYGLPSYHLDKDLLVAGNRVYSQDNCVLIPDKLNSFLLTKPARKGGLPTGVSIRKETGKYHAQISIDGKVTHLGYFQSVETAKEAYVEAKIKEARRWYLRLLSGEFIVDSRVIERMRTWTCN